MYIFQVLFPRAKYFESLKGLPKLHLRTLRRTPGFRTVDLESLYNWNALTLQLLACSDSLIHIQCFFVVIELKAGNMISMNLTYKEKHMSSACVLMEGQHFEVT